MTNVKNNIRHVERGPSIDNFKMYIRPQKKMRPPMSIRPQSLETLLHSGEYFKPLHLFTPSTSSGNLEEQVVSLMERQYRDVVTERLSEVFPYVAPVLTYLREPDPESNLHPHLAPIMQGQPSRRIFLSGGCAGYLLGR